MCVGISVVIPVYNGAQYLSECIRSVHDQTLPVTEIIVIDDGSEDETPKVAATWDSHIRYRRVPHRGAACARNHGLRIAEMDFIAFIDSDDVWLPRKLELQMTTLSQELGATMAFGYVEEFISSDLTPQEAAKLRCRTTPLPGICASTLLMRKSDCERAGPFDESIQTGEFIEWCSRARDLGVKQIVVPEVVSRRRLHRTNFGRGGTAVHRGYASMLKKVLERRRARD